MGTFRVKLNLQYYYQDYRKQVFILVDKEWPNVKSLMDHIVRLFKINNNFILTTEDGTYLSKSENINIVLPSDVLIAQPLNNSNNKKSDIMATASCVPEPKILLNSKKKRKNKVKEDVSISPVLDPVFSSSIIESDCENDDLNQSEAVAERRKRRRIRKKKEKKIVKTPESVVTQEVNSYKKEIPKIINNRIDVSSEKVHIRFNEDGSALGNGSREHEVTKVYTKRTIPRVITAIREENIINENNDSNEMEITPVETSIIKSNDKSLSSSFWWDNEMEIDKEKVPKKCEVEKTNPPPPVVNENLESLRQNIDSLKLPKISSDPKQFDTIAFKILTMTDNFMPQLSNYIIGMIDSFNENNQETKITILAGKSELKKPIGKFSLPTADDEEPDELFNNDVIEIQWNEVHDARSLETEKIL